MIDEGSESWLPTDHHFFKLLVDKFQSISPTGLILIKPEELVKSDRYLQFWRQLGYNGYKQLLAFATKPNESIEYYAVFYNKIKPGIISNKFIYQYNETDDILSAIKKHVTPNIPTGYYEFIKKEYYDKEGLINIYNFLETIFKK